MAFPSMLEEGRVKKSAEVLLETKGLEFMMYGDGIWNKKVQKQAAIVPANKVDFLKLNQRFPREPLIFSYIFQRKAGVCTGLSQ